MKNLLLIILLLMVCLSLAIVKADAQTAYGISVVRASPTTRVVDGYSGTWLDYYAGLYYDPEVIGDIYRTDNPETSLSYGRSIGFADILPAEVYLSTTNYVEGKSYCTYSQHFVWSYFYYQPTGYWFDPFQYSLFSAGEPPWSGYPFTYYYAIPRRNYLGWTQACITIPIPPPPTPTPTPTPEPSPSPTPPDPCDSLLEGESCTEYTVRLTVSPRTLRPKKTTSGNNTAKVDLCIEPAQANKTVTLQLTPSANTGGHIDSLHLGSRPLGNLTSSRGTTGSDGCFSTTYSPSHISGIVGIKGSITGTETGVAVDISVPGFYTLLPSNDYNLIGQTSPHPSNHWGTQGAVDTLPLIARDYNAMYYGGNPPPVDKRVSFNDMSLVGGGKFDLKKKSRTAPDWTETSAHAEHRDGTICDVRSNNIDTNHWTDLKAIFNARGFGIHDETGTDAPHWHIRHGNLNNDVASHMVDGIEKNPDSLIEVNPSEVSTSDFVESLLSVRFDRVSTQEEWEILHPQVVDAKAQGQTQLLAKARELEQQLFASSEYVARNTSDEDFIDDVFQAHLFRGATGGEKVYWTNILDSFSSEPQQVARMQMIETFESRQAFTDAILGIVDLAPPVFPVSISGRVKDTYGRPISMAIVTLTDSQGISRNLSTGTFGYYTFNDVLTGQSYVLKASSRRYSFEPRFVTLTGELTGFDFIAKP